LNMYLVGYASNRGEDLNNPSLARYPNAWSISRVAPTHKNQLGLWRFHCNNITKDFTQLNFKGPLPNGWHLFTVSWSVKGNYIKFIVDDAIADESAFHNWPSDYSHSIHLGIWASRAKEFYFNSKVGPWQFVPLGYNTSIIEQLVKLKPE
jgi:hypothetical protein